MLNCICISAFMGKIRSGNNAKFVLNVNNMTFYKNFQGDQIGVIMDLKSSFLDLVIQLTPPIGR